VININELFVCNSDFLILEHQYRFVVFSKIFIDTDSIIDRVRSIIMQARLYFLRYCIKQMIIFYCMMSWKETMRSDQIDDQ